MAEFVRWQNFYVIVGPSGAVLIGVQFVVVTLIASMRTRPTAEAVSAFATPTVVHLGGALCVSAIMSAALAVSSPLLLRPGYLRPRRSWLRGGCGSARVSANASSWLAAQIITRLSMIGAIGSRQIP